MLDEHFEERAFALEEMLAAFNVEEETFGVLDIFDGRQWAEAGAGLEGELVKDFTIGGAVDGGKVKRWGGRGSRRAANVASESL
jgi:hypothetical protein